MKAIAKFAVAMAMATGLSTAAMAKELRYATNAPEATPWGDLAKGWAAHLADLSGGELTLKVFFGGALGDEQELTRQVVRGRLDIAGVSATGVSQAVPEIAVMSLPYVFDSSAQRYCVEDNHMDAVLGDLMDEAGIVSLGVVETGHEIIFSKTNIAAPEDLAGMKLRTPTNRSAVGYFQSLNASVVPSGVQDIIPGLQTGALEGAVTATLFGFGIGVPKMAPNILVTNHVGSAGNIIVSKKVWGSLSEQEQGWLEESYKFLQNMRNVVAKAEGGVLAQAAGAGANVVQLTDEQTATWAAAAEAVRPELIAGISDKAPGIWDRLATAKAACN